MLAILIISIIIIIIVIFLSAITTSKAYQFKHTIDEVPETMIETEKDQDSDKKGV